MMLFICFCIVATFSIQLVSASITFDEHALFTYSNGTTFTHAGTFSNFNYTASSDSFFFDGSLYPSPLPSGYTVNSPINGTHYDSPVTVDITIYDSETVQYAIYNYATSTWEVGLTTYTIPISYTLQPGYHQINTIGSTSYNIYFYVDPPATPTPSGSSTPAPTSTSTSTPTPTFSPITSSVEIITIDPFIVAFNSTEGFNVQDTIRGTFINFTVISGQFYGTGILNVNASSGEFIVNNLFPCTIAVDYDPSLLRVTVNDAPFSRFITMDSSGTYAIKWVSATPAVIVVTGGQVYYFRSDEYTTNNYTTYGFDSSYTNTNTTLSINTTASTVMYGYQVYIYHFDGSTTELTDGTPDGTITLTSPSSGWQTSTWNCPGQNLILGYDAIQIQISVSTDDGATWTTVANFISPVIISNVLNPSTWTLNLYATYDGSQATIQFGDAAHKSNINGIQFVVPLQSDVALWRLSRGDYIGFLLGEYLDEIGVGFYGLILFGAASTLYMRYKHFGTIAFMFAVFGGPGGIIWLFLPAWGAAVGSAIIIIGLSFVVWRVIR